MARSSQPISPGWARPAGQRSRRPRLSESKSSSGILNYFTAPFGSQEYLLLYFGVEGPDWAWDANGNPQQTRKAPRTY